MLQLKVQDKKLLMKQKRYQPMQNVTVPPGGNIVLPVSLGLQNRIQTTFKNVSVSTTAPPEDTTIYVEGGSVFITTEKDAPVGIMLSEEGVPASTYNLTLIPIDAWRYDSCPNTVNPEYGYRTRSPYC
jgi:conjugal transfer pilus assembly protein TraK